MSAPRDHLLYEEMAAAFVLGALDAAERSEFVAHLESGCPICRELHPQLEEVADMLLVAPPPVTPPPDLRGRILAAAGVPAAAVPTPSASGAPRRAELRAVRGGSRERVYALLALAAAVALMVLTPLALRWRNELGVSRQESAARAEQLRQLTAELDGLRTTSAQQAALLDLVGRSESGFVTLASLAPAPGASGKVLWDRAARKGYLWVRNLPVDPEGKDYELWAIQGGTPVNAGVFSVSADGSALIPLGDLSPGAPVATFAITLEPAGGVSAPTGPMVLAGNTGG